MSPVTRLLMITVIVCCLANRQQAQSNVGVGTLTPAYRLDVEGDAASTILINLYSKVNYTGALDIKAIEGLSLPGDGFGIGGKFTGGSKGLEALGNGGTSNTSVYGVYGSSTGSSGSRIGVYGTSSGGVLNFGLYGAVTGGVGNYALYATNSNTAGYAGYFNGRGHFSEELRADKNMIVDDNLGIGTLSPATRLHIATGQDASYTTNGFIQTGNIDGWNLLIDDNEILARNNGLENELFIQRDGGDLLLCALEAGSVGIGLTAGTSIPAGYMLAVDGKIIGEEMRIQNSASWPDYVFQETYNLMSLAELKQSISANHHLPNIPSAGEVATNGILVGDMQKRMMQKIEELTLYVIQLHEITESQTRKIEDLEKALTEKEKP